MSITFPEELMNEDYQMKPIREIELLDGTVVPIKTRMSLAQLKKYRHEGLLSFEVVQTLMNGNIEKALDDPTMYSAPYVAYLLGGGELNQEKFEELLPMNFQVFMQIYMQLLNGGAEQRDDNFRRSLGMVTKK